MSVPNKKKRNRLLLNILGLLSLVIAWQFLSTAEGNPAIPSVKAIAEAFCRIITDAKLYTSLFSTIKLVVIGVLMATAIGVAVAFLMSLNDNIKHIIMPIVECLRNIPAITLFPMLLVIFGIGDSSRIFVIFWTAYPSIVIQAYYGLNNIERSIIEAAQNCGASKLQIYRYIRFPLAVFDILNGVRIAIGAGFIAIVVAEMLGATKGLGYMILWCTNSFKYPETYAYIVLVAAIGGIFNYITLKIINKFERKML